MAHDVRSIANFVLDCAERESVGVTNLALNKIIYFMHVAFLHHFGEPLVTAKIEAWDHGPVFREVYHQFKVFGSKRITGRARRMDLSSGTYLTARHALLDEEFEYATAQCERLLRVPAGRLVDLSHIEDGAWHRARYSDGRINPGMEITNQLILEAGLGNVRH